MKKGLILVVCGLLASGNAAADVHTAQSPELAHVRVTRVDSQHVRFELCSDLGQKECQLLGGRDFTLEELHRTSRSELEKALGKTSVKLAANVAGIASFLSAFVVLIFSPAVSLGKSMALDVPLEPAYPLSSKALMAVGFTAPFWMTATMIKVDSYNNYNNARAIRKDIVDGHDVRVLDISEYTKDLNQALTVVSTESARAQASPAK